MKKPGTIWWNADLSSASVNENSIMVIKRALHERIRFE